MAVCRPILYPSELQIRIRKKSTFVRNLRLSYMPSANLNLRDEILMLETNLKTKRSPSTSSRRCSKEWTLLNRFGSDLASIFSSRVKIRWATRASWSSTLDISALWSVAQRPGPPPGRPKPPNTVPRIAFCQTTCRCTQHLFSDFYITWLSIFAWSSTAQSIRPDPDSGPPIRSNSSFLGRVH